MQRFQRWPIRLSALLLVLAATLAHSQARQLQGGVPAEARLLYQAVGVASSGAQVTMVLHCSNISPLATTLWLEIRDSESQTTNTATALAQPGHTVTLAIQDTALYAEDAVAGGTARQGWAGIYSDDARARVICTGQLLDPTHAAPDFILQLQLFNAGGRLLQQELPYATWLPMIRR